MKDNHKYMIRNKEGMYSRGGSEPIFTNLKFGKVWNSLGSLKNHLNCFLGHNKPIPDDWLVIELEVVEKELISAKELYEKHYLIQKFKEKEQAKKANYYRLLEERRKIEEEIVEAERGI
jgi:hypothetical protein